METRAQQALGKMALEPEWEARFEANSFGFRSGRSCHDAIEAILNAIRYKPKYVFDADISGCFDNIDQKALLAKLNTYLEPKGLKALNPSPATDENAFAVLKSGKYGTPGLPIVVAVNLLSTFGDERAVEQALFGSLALRVPIGGDASATETIRQQDGVWMRDGQPLATRVSAVLEGPGLSPWTIAQKWPRLWLNPWAAHPLEIDIPVPQRVGDMTGRVEYLDSQTPPRQLFNLVEDWPGPIS